MKITIVECVLGILALDHNNNVVESILFPKRASQIVDTLQKLQIGLVPIELKELINKLKQKSYRTFVFEDDNLAWKVGKQYDIEVSVEKPSAAGEYIRSNLAGFAMEKGYVESAEELDRIVYAVTNTMAKKGVRLESGRRDLLLIQAIQTINDLDETLNLFSNRIKEWYGFYFPELGDLVEGNEAYLNLVASLTKRSLFTETQLVERGIDREQAIAVSKAAHTSIGAEIAPRNLIEIQKLAKNLLLLYTLRRDLEKYVDEVMIEIAPNTRSLVGSILGARLIAAVGWIGNLAKKSASKIQVLGAEKALYRSLKTGTNPPKHGVIFHHTAVRQAPRWQRGKIARALAGKLSIAVRLDFFDGGYRGEELMKDLTKRVEEIKEKYAEPPKRGRRGKRQ